MDGYALPGFGLWICGPESPVREALNATFQLCPPAAEEGASRLDAVTLLSPSRDNLMPDWLRDDVDRCLPSEAPMMFYGSTGEIAVVTRNEFALCYAWASETREQLRLVFQKRCSGPAPLSVQSVMDPLLREVMLSKQHVLLHAASVACPNGIGVAIIGDGGGGKTTTAVSMLRLGAGLLGDDLIGVRCDSEGATAVGIPEPLNLTAQTMGFFEEFDSVEGTSFGPPSHTKKFVRPQEVYGDDCLTEQCPLHVVYFVRVTETGPACRPLSVGDALSRLIRAHTFAGDQRVTPESVSKLLDILAHVKPYELHTGPDPSALGRWLIDHSEEHAQG